MPSAQVIYYTSGYHHYAHSKLIEFAAWRWHSGMTSIKPLLGWLRAPPPADFRVGLRAELSPPLTPPRFAERGIKKKFEEMISVFSVGGVFGGLEFGDFGEPYTHGFDVGTVMKKGVVGDIAPQWIAEKQR